MVRLLMHCMLNIYLVFPASLLFIEQTPGKDDGLKVVSMLLLISLFVGILNLYFCLKLFELSSEDKEGVRSIIKKYLMIDGWMVSNDNQKYLKAERSYGLLTHHFYIIYQNEKVFICPLYDYPFPFSLLAAHRDRKILKIDG
jgi:hypothetical protein